MIPDRGARVDDCTRPHSLDRPIHAGKLTAGNSELPVPTSQTSLNFQYVLNLGAIVLSDICHNVRCKIRKSGGGHAIPRGLKPCDAVWRFGVAK
jgi:hypothetical protein